MQLIDEQNDLPFGIRNFLEYRLEPFFELSPEFRTGNKSTHIKGNDAFLLHCFGYVPLGDTLGKSLDYGSLTDTCLTDEHRVVLPAPGKYLDCMPYLLIPANYRVQFTLRCQFGEVDTVFL